MYDYISREAALIEIGDADDTLDAEQRVWALPAADVVEVIRCADCRCFQANMRQDGYLPNGVPEYECRWRCGEVDPTGYCFHAKRKDGGQEDV